MSSSVIAVVGLDIGHAASFSASLQEEGFEIGYVWDRLPERAAAFAARFGASVVSRLDAMPWERLGGGLMTVKANEHARAAIPFLTNGVPVFIDKQMAAHWEDARAVQTAAERHGVPFLSGSIRRFAPGYCSVALRVMEGDLGRSLSAHFFEPHGVTAGGWQDHPQESGGFLVSFGIHCADPLVAMLGSEIAEVNALGGRLVHTDALSEDLCLITVLFRNGTVATLEILGAQQPVCVTQPMVRLHCARGSLETRIDEGPACFVGGKPLYDPETYDLVSGKRGMVRAISRLFREKTWVVSLSEQMAVMKLLMMAQRSQREQRRVRWDEW